MTGTNRIAVAAILASIWSVTQAEVWSGPVITFSKPAFGDPAMSQNQDRITDQVWLTRGNTQGLFNIRLSSMYSFNEPLDTRWAFASLNGNPATVSAAEFAQLTFTNWASALGGMSLLATNILNRPGVLHLISDDIYIDIEFDTWGQRVIGGGAFSYERTTPTDTDGDGNPDVTDPDDDNDGIGDTLDTAPLIASNLCTSSDGDNATLGVQVVADLTCAAQVSIEVQPATQVLGPPAHLHLIAPTIWFQSGFSVLQGGQLTVISADPCPGCSP